jgi:hypothetical protein
MNITELMQSYFGAAAAGPLARASGLDAQAAQRALSVALPMQVDALADHAATPQGQAQIADAMQNLPAFGSVQEALDSADGASNLERAGELLSPALLGGRSGVILNAVTGQASGASPDSLQKLLNMALPLLLSFLAQRGLSAAALTEVKGTLGTLDLGGTQATPSTAAVGASAGLGAAGVGVTTGTAALTAGGLLDLLKAEFGGANADRIAGAAGFGGGGQRATMAALPLLLGALSTRGRTEAGASEVLSMARGFTGLTDSGGHLNLGFLDNNAETTRVEGQGRGLLGSLFGNVDELTGRLGSALGSSGSNASRLLSLLAPLLLSVLGSRAGATNLGAGGLSGLLGGLAPLLPGLLPAGMSGLSSLLGTPATTTTTVAATPTRVETPVTPVAPTPAPRPVATATTSTTTVTPKRGGIPWWLIPLLLLLLLGGCWLLRPQNNEASEGTTPAATEQAASILVTNPTGDANLPPEPFTMSGTGPAGTSLRIEDQGQEVATASVDDSGNWSAELPAPTVGEHTYSVIGGENVRSEFKVNVTDDAADTGTGTGDAATDSPAEGSADTPTDGDVATTDDTTGADAATGADTAATSPATGTFAISEPAADATLAAGGFTLRGTGTPGESLQVLEDGTSLGNVTVGDDGNWSLDVPSPAAGAHTYAVQGPDGTELGSVSATIGEAEAGATAASCTDEYSLSITDGQTVSEPFRFGGKGSGEGYTVTVKRGDRTIGTKDIALDATCGWSYQSKPGAGTITYEVRPLGDAAAEPLSAVNLTVDQ